jgi:N-acetylglucosaminyldiphosphoundecaprenol N-acetyl-beta-D-mannosaminyltransferase
MSPVTVLAQRQEQEKAERMRRRRMHPYSYIAVLRIQAVRRKVMFRLWQLFCVQSFEPVKRLTDVVIAVLALVVCGPVFLFYSIRGAISGTRMLQKQKCIGRHGEVFAFYSFSGGDTCLRQLPSMINLLRGDISLIGPRIRCEGDADASLWGSARRQVKPGLICFWWIRRRVNTDFDEEIEVDREYLDTATLKQNIGIAVRAVPAVVYGGRAASAQTTVSLLGVPIDNLNMNETLAWVLQAIECRGPSKQISFVNSHCFNISVHDAQYRRSLISSDLVLADGIGVRIAAKMTGQCIRQNVNGTDLFPRLCRALQKTGKSIYLLGARPGVAQAVADWTSQHYPGVVIAGFHNGYFSSADDETVAREIHSSGASVLLVALGAPRQEVWIARYLPLTGVKLAFGVGGLFDFYSGSIPRAPIWVREIGMEWAFRLIQEPGRMWRRYLIGNWTFLTRALLHRQGAAAVRLSRER